MTAALTALTVLSALAALMATPPKYLPDYQRGGWGKYAR